MKNNQHSILGQLIEFQLKITTFSIKDTWLRQKSKSELD